MNDVYKVSPITLMLMVLVAEFNDYVRFLQKENLKQGRGGGVDLLFIDPTERGLRLAKSCTKSWRKTHIFPYIKKGSQ